MVIEGSLTCLQESPAGTHPNEPSYAPYFFRIHFNIILPPTVAASIFSYQFFRPKLFMNFLSVVQIIGLIRTLRRAHSFATSICCITICVVLICRSRYVSPLVGKTTGVNLPWSKLYGICDYIDSNDVCSQCTENHSNKRGASRITNSTTKSDGYRIFLLDTPFWARIPRSLT